MSLANEIAQWAMILMILWSLNNALPALRLLLDRAGLRAPTDSEAEDG